MMKSYFNRISGYFYFYVIVSTIVFWILIISGSGGDWGSGIGEGFILMIYLSVLNLIIGYRIKKFVQPQLKKQIVRNSFFIIYSAFYGIVFLSETVVYILKFRFEDFGLVFPMFIGIYFTLMIFCGSFYLIGTLFVKNKKTKG